METHNNKTLELIKNTIIIFLGKFCTQFISLILLILYTFYLSTEEYGTIDLIQTYILLLVPIISMRLDSMFFRFLVNERKNEERKKKVISNGCFLTILLLIIFSIIYAIICQYINIPYNKYIYFNILVVVISNNLMQLLRGIGDNIGYAISCIIVGVINIIGTLILFIGLKMRGEAILLATIISNFMCSIFIIFRGKIYKYINGNIDKKEMLKMLKYTLPMIPDGLSWWIVNVSDRMMIKFFINASANGIYAVASKFSNILSSIFSIINLSWQESASININSPDRDEFFSKIFNNIMKITISVCIEIMASMFIIFKFFIDNSYENAYQYITILLVANIINALTILQGGVLVAKMDTKSSAISTMFGALVNIILNYLFISKFKLYMAAISTLISYVVIAIIRQINIRKYVKIKYNLKMYFKLFSLLIFTIIIYYVKIVYVQILYLLFITLYLVWINKEYIMQILKKVFSKLNGLYNKIKFEKE